jgi:neutral trehalase
MSHDEKSRSAPRRFLIDVEETIRLVLEQEDTDGDFQISITDAGPKILSLGTATSNGFKTFDIRVRPITISSRLPTDGLFVCQRALTCCRTSSKNLL